MNPKQFIVVGTVAIAITLGGGIWCNESSAHPSLGTQGKCSTFKSKEAKITIYLNTPVQENGLANQLGMSEDELYHALYDGNSLADIAEERQVDVQSIIDLQVAEMTQQLDQRLASGSLTPETYHLQKSELPAIIAESTYLRYS